MLKQLLNRIHANDPTLTQIDLSMNQIGDDGAKALAKALKQNLTVTQINLRDNKIGDAGAKALAEALKINQTLMLLDLSQNQIDVTGARALAEALKQNQTLTQIHLHHNQIGYDFLDEVLPHFKTMELREEDVDKELNLEEILQGMRTLEGKIEQERYGDAGVEALAEALKQNHTLTQIDLSYNHIADDGAQALAKALQRNKSLIQINLEGNGISDADRKTIKGLIKRNKALKQRQANFLNELAVLSRDSANKASSSLWSKLPKELQLHILMLIEFDFAHLDKTPSQVSLCVQFMLSNASTLNTLIKAKLPCKLVEKIDLGSTSRFKFFVQDQLNKTNNDGKTPLYITAENGHAALVKLLLKHPCIEVNKANRDGEETPLYIAAEIGHEAVVELLLKHPDIQVNKADINERTPLWMAAQKSHKAVVGLLLKHPDIEVNKADINGCTPLFVAAARGDTAVVELLLKHPNIEVNKATSNAKSPLLIAVEKDYASVVKLLLKHPDIDVNKADVNGVTPLFIATARGHTAVVEPLLKHPDIEVNKATSKAKTPLLIAAERGHVPCIKLLLKRNGVIAANADWINLPLTQFSEAVKISPQHLPLLYCKQAFEKGVASLQQSSANPETFFKPQAAVDCFYEAKKHHPEFFNECVANLLQNSKVKLTEEQRAMLVELSEPELPEEAQPKSSCIIS